MRTVKVKIFEIFSLVVAFAIVGVSPAFSKNDSWKDIKAELVELRAKFSNPKLSFNQRIDLMPRTNELLSVMQDLKFTPDENKKRIKLVVSVIAATSEIDVARSNTDVLYGDFEKNKETYLKEIRALKSPKQKQAVLLGFKQWEAVGDGPDDPVGSPAIKPKSGDSSKRK